MNYDYLSAEEFDYMTEDELDKYYKIKKEMKKEETEEPLVPPPMRDFGTVDLILDTDYDEEMDLYLFEVIFYNGEHIHFNLKGHQIKQMYLFLNYKNSEKKYINHINKND